MNRQLSCRPGNYGPAVHRAYEEMQRAGIRLVELHHMPAEEMLKQRPTYEAFGINAASVQAPLDVRSPDCASAIEPWLHAARELGARVVFVSAGALAPPPVDGALARVKEALRRIKLPESQPEKDAAYERLSQCGDLAASYGVTLVLETHPDLMHDTPSALETMRRVDHPNVRMNFDTANIHFFSEAGTDEVADLSSSIDYLGAIHLKEIRGGFMDWYFPALGEGRVKWTDVFAVLERADFNGPLTLEIEGIKGETLDEDGYIQRVADSVNHLRTLGLVD